MKCRFNDKLELSKGERIIIKRAVPDTNPLTVTLIESISKVKIHKSKTDGVISAFPPVTLANPIIGRVVSSDIHQYYTDFEIEEGKIDDHVFVKFGEKNKGQEAIIEILTNRLDMYVKIWDPYISPDDIPLISNVPPNIDILILTENIRNIEEIRRQISMLENKTLIKKGTNFHDRFILTRGEGWSSGHSLKDFGTKYSLLSKMESCMDVENAFDENWNQAALVLANVEK